LVTYPFLVVKFHLDGREPSPHKHRPGTPRPTAPPASESEAENKSRPSSAKSNKNEEQGLDGDVLNNEESVENELKEELELEKQENDEGKSVFVL
jgi:hypothetical protein